MKVCAVALPTSESDREISPIRSGGDVICRSHHAQIEGSTHRSIVSQILTPHSEFRVDTAKIQVLQRNPAVEDPVSRNFADICRPRSIARCKRSCGSAFARLISRIPAQRKVRLSHTNRRGIVLHPRVADPFGAIGKSVDAAGRCRRQ